jgi:rhamnosyltransferase
MNFKLKNDNIKLSEIAPSYIDSNTNQLQPFVKFIPFNKKIIPKEGINYVSQVISSGMIIPSTIFKIVGFKNEALFIDWVDFEWCWRSIRMGYRVIAYGDVVINHNLGDGVVLFLGKEISIRTPFRHYFMIRNAIYLSLYTDCLNLPMRFEIFIKTLLWVFIFPLSSKRNKFEHFKATLLGFYHGLSAQLGAKP